MAPIVVSGSPTARFVRLPPPTPDQAPKISRFVRLPPPTPGQALFTPHISGSPCPSPITPGPHLRIPHLRSPPDPPPNRQSAHYKRSPPPTKVRGSPTAPPLLAHGRLRRRRGASEPGRGPGQIRRASVQDPAGAAYTAGVPRLSFKQRLQRQAKIAARPPSKTALAESARQEQALADLIAMSEGQSARQQKNLLDIVDHAERTGRVGARSPTTSEWDGPRILVERTEHGAAVVFTKPSPGLRSRKK